MSCGVGCRHGSEPVLLWLWRRPAAMAPIIPLAWEPPYALGAALEKAKRQGKRKCLLLEFPLWHSGLRIQMQWLRSLQRHRFNPRFNARSSIVAGATQVTAVAQIQSLAQELPYATAVVIKKNVYFFLTFHFTFWVFLRKLSSPNKRIELLKEKIFCHSTSQLSSFKCGCDA